MPILKTMKPFLPFFIASLRRVPFAVFIVIPVVLLHAITLAERQEADFSVQNPFPEQQQSLPMSPEFSNGVKAYREGDYIQARRIFSGLHKQSPEDTRITYYFAITEAQLGRFQAAKTLYQEIITLDPKGEAAQLAKTGLQYLPAEASLDLPPRFQTGAANTSQPHAATAQQAIPQSQAGSIPGQGMMPNGMSMQDWMALQMLMGQGGNASNNLGGGGVNNMMPWMMMPQAGTDPNNPGSGYDPNAMSTMLMNQMMQNFSLSGDKDENR